MFSRLRKGRGAPEAKNTVDGAEDQAGVIGPEEARKRGQKDLEEYLQRHAAPAHQSDMSWLENAPERTTPSAPVAPPKAAAPKPAPAAAPKPKGRPKQAPNAPAAARSRYPHGWLVVVEGPGTGEWFVLERGAAQIGRAEGQTVALTFGDDGIADENHAELTYDEARHDFVVRSGADVEVRVNGIPTKAQVLRDGDVISLGSTALRLVALCSKNFHWNKELGDG